MTILLNYMTFTDTYQRVTDLWDGRVDDQDKALQLVLILDYIYFWACHNYRPSILQELKILFDHGADDRSKLIGYRDSTVNPEVDDLTTDLEDMEQRLQKLRLAMENSDCHRLTHRLKSPLGVVRNARLIDSRFYGVQISSMNVDEFLSYESSGFGRRPESVLISALENEPLLVSRSALNAIETVWTGNVQMESTFPSAAERFLAKISFVNYITSDWKQVRELSYVAVSLAAIDCIRVRFGDRVLLKALDTALEVDYDFLVGYCSHLKRGPISFNLQCALTHLAVNIPQSLERDRPPFNDKKFDNSACYLVHDILTFKRRLKGFGSRRGLLRMSYREDEQKTNQSSPSFPLSIGISDSVLLIRDVTWPSQPNPRVCLFMMREYSENLGKVAEASMLKSHLVASTESSLYRVPDVSTRESISAWNCHKDIWNIKDEHYHQINVWLASLHPEVSPSSSSLITQCNTKYRSDT